ncbi:hypothetical protein H4R18_000694 [Coemansia javaensis]|uniref:Inhibitor I9 domain-containing protein n=1 Tax=Coemansia javaensis TaxID=2761396 RepID=A0A9W8HHG6_9FUNG|nr:hypothetical protein H4R18_000694 [Coemansia javaensis]
MGNDTGHKRAIVLLKDGATAGQEHAVKQSILAAGGRVIERSDPGSRLIPAIFAELPQNAFSSLHSQHADAIATVEHDSGVSTQQG